MNERRHVLIVEARFYEDLADQLVNGAVEVLEREGVAYTRWAVPGCFELPAAIRFALAAQGSGLSSDIYASQFDGYLALGCVIRGETDHYDHICRETTRALMDMSVQDGIALGFGVLTCHTYEQARQRAAVDGQNKGGDAARACLRMMSLRQGLSRLA